MSLFRCSSKGTWPQCLLLWGLTLTSLRMDHLCKDKGRGGLTVAVTASVLLPLGGQQAEAMGQVAELTKSSGSLGSSWTGTPTRGSPPSPPKCGREKKASQREILSGKPASSCGGNPQRHLPRAGRLVAGGATALRGRMLIGCRPGTGRGAARYQVALGSKEGAALGPRPGPGLTGRGA